MNPKGISSVCAIALFACFASACNKSSPQTTALPFEWTNIVHEASAFQNIPSTGTLVHFPNGTWSGHYSDLFTIGLGTADYEATVFFNPTNREITKIVQQTTVGTNHFWLIDTNGDGVPDERRQFGQKGDERDLLVRGDWLRARGRSEREVFLDNEWHPVHFTNNAWRLVRPKP